MNPQLRQRVRIDGSIIGIVQVVSLGNRSVISGSLKPNIPKGTYIEMEFILGATKNESLPIVARYPGVVLKSGGDQMEVRLENMNDVYIELLRLFSS